MILQRDVLRAQVFLDGERVIRAPLHRGIVGDNQHVSAGDAADAGHDAGGRRVIVVHSPRGQRRQLEKCHARIEQGVDALPHGHLALLAMARDIFDAATLASLLHPRAVLVDERLHALAVGAVILAIDIEVRLKAIHYQPQQSLLKRHDGQRHTACMRYMPAPQRSHCITSSAGAGAAAPRIDTTGVTITLWGEEVVGGTFSGGLSTAAIIRPQIGSERSSGNAFQITAVTAPGCICGHRPVAPCRAVARKASKGGIQREMMAASAAATSVIVATNEPRVTRRVMTNSSLLTLDC